MKKRIFIAIQYLEIGGAERALIGLLNAIDYSQYDVDLFIYRHTGEFMKLIPKQVNLLLPIKKYTTLTRPIKEILKEGYIDIALARLYAHWRAFLFDRKVKESISIFQYVANYTTPLLPSLKCYGTYDLAISFLTPHNIVRDKVSARKKIAWIHTDYSYVGVDVKAELPVWSAYDNIISISDSVTESFIKTFPTLKERIVMIENILSEPFIKQQAKMSVDDVMDENHIRLCTVARFSYPKAIDRAVFICRDLVNRGIDIRWYIVGYGTDEELIRKNIKETGMEDYFILLGKKANPYPYINSCDIYVQPSRYEGKAVTVREAQILCKPVVITNYPTAKDQLVNGIDGIILPNEMDKTVHCFEQFITGFHAKQCIVSYLHQHHYGNEDEVKKLYELMPDRN